MLYLPKKDGSVHILMPFILLKKLPDLDNIWTEGYYGDKDKSSDVEQDDKEGWRIFTENDGDLILMKGVGGEPYKITYTNQYEVSIEDNGSIVCKGSLLSELMQDIVKVSFGVTQIMFFLRKLVLKKQVVEWVQH